MMTMGMEREIAVFCLASVGFTSVERAIAFSCEEDEQGKLIH